VRVRERDHRDTADHEHKSQALLLATERPLWAFTGVRGPGALLLVPSNYRTDGFV
jgi:hypothetical protein